MTSSNPLESPKSPPRGIAPSRIVLIWLAVLVGLLVIFWIASPERPSTNPENQPGIGQSLSKVDLLPLTGRQPSISREDLANHVTLLNFWGTWCPPCRAELPHLAALRQRFAGREAFQLLAVSCPGGGMASDDEQPLRDDTAALLKRLKLDLPTYYDPRSATRAALAKLTGDESIVPFTVLLDRKGVIRAVWVGYWPGAEAEMERRIGMALDEKDEKNKKTDEGPSGRGRGA